MAEAEELEAQTAQMEQRDWGISVLIQMERWERGGLPPQRRVREARPAQEPNPGEQRPGGN